MTENAEPRWGLLMPLLTAGFCPAKTARRTDHLSGWDAIAIHMLALVLLVLAITGALFWRGGPVLEVVGSVERCLVRVLTVCVMLDVPYLLLGFLLTAWGARRERMQTSVGRAIHRTLRHTPHVTQACIMASVLAVPCFLADAGYSGPSRSEIQNALDSLASQGLDRDALATRQRALDIVEDRRPFYSRYGCELGTTFYFVGGLWCFFGLLAAIGAVPVAKRDDEHPPICECCEYNLTGLAMEGRCPECGTPVLESLGPDTRPGTVWQRRGDLGRWDAFWSMMGSALFEPMTLGRQMTSEPEEGDHRSFAVIWAAILFAVAWLTGVLFFTEDCLVPVRCFDPAGFEFRYPAKAAFAAMAVIVVTSASALLVGWWASRHHRRSVLPTAMQAAAAAVVFLLAGLSLAWAYGGLLRIAGVLLFDQGTSGGFLSALVITFLTWIPRVVIALAYLWIIVRIVQGARCANK